MGSMRASPPLRLVGRTLEQAALEATIAAVSGGKGQLVIVEGEAGIGKSALVEAALRGRPGFWEVVGGGDELAAHRPYGMLLDALRRMRRRPAGLEEIDSALTGRAPELGGDGSSGEYVLVEAAKGVVEGLAATGPGLVLLEDLQWADPASLRLAVRLANAIADLPVLLALTWREPLGALREIEPQFGRVPGGRLRLGPLGPAEAEELAAAIVGRPLETPERRRIAKAAGNPFFVSELATAIASDVTVPSDDVPTSVREAVRRRIAALPGLERDEIRIAAVLGTTFKTADLALVRHVPSASLVGAITGLVEHGIIEAIPEGLRFRHELIREAIYQDVPPELRAALHREFADTLAAAGRPASVVAGHVIRGAHPNDAESAARLAAAAGEAAVAAPAIAVDLLDRAIALAPPGSPDIDRYRAHRAAALLWSGGALAAEQEARRLLAAPHSPDLDDVLRPTLVFSLLAEGRVGDGLAEAVSGIDAPEMSTAGRARLRAWLATAFAIAGQAEPALAHGRLAVIEGERSGDPFAAVMGFAAEGLVRRAQGRFGQALEIMTEAVVRADATPGLVAHRFQLLGGHAVCLMDHDRFDDSIASIERGRILAERLGTPWNLGIYDVAMALLNYLTGGWDDVERYVRDAVDVMATTGATHTLAVARSVVVMIRVHRGDPEGARRELEAAEAELRETGPQWGSHWAGLARAVWLEATTDARSAFEALDGVWRQLEATGLHHACVELAVDLVRLAVAAEEGDRAREVAERTAETIVGEHAPELRFIRTEVLALAHGDAHGHAEAIAAADEGGRPFEQARARELAATARGSGDAGGPAANETKLLLQRALEIYERLGATSPAARVAARLRALGVRRGARGRRARPSMGWQALTPAELGIATLVAEGRSNPEIARLLFLSRHTVHTHLSHIFRKLELRSRVELASAMGRRNEASVS
jgi:DNA-binding CsgD family transcriptional regulator